LHLVLLRLLKLQVRLELLRLEVGVDVFNAHGGLLLNLLGKTLESICDVLVWRLCFLQGMSLDALLQLPYELSSECLSFLFGHKWLHFVNFSFKSTEVSERISTAQANLCRLSILHHQLSFVDVQKIRLLWNGCIFRVSCSVCRRVVRLSLHCFCSI
jgi:hypothetical protein